MLVVVYKQVQLETYKTHGTSSFIKIRMRWSDFYKEEQGYYIQAFIKLILTKTKLPFTLNILTHTSKQSEMYKRQRKVQRSTFSTRLDYYLYLQNHVSYTTIR